MLSSFLHSPEGYPCPTHNFSATRDKARGHEGTQGASGADRRVRAQGTPQTFRKLTPRTAFVATSEPLPRAIQLRACNVEGISFGDENNTPNGSEPQHYRPSSSNTVATQKPAKGQISDQERSRSIVERGLLCAREAIHSTVPRDRSKEGGAPSTHLGSSKPDRRPDRLQRSKQTDHQQTPAPVSNYPRNGCDLENSKTVRRNESRDRVQRKTVKRYQEGVCSRRPKGRLRGCHAAHSETYRHFVASAGRSPDRRHFSYDRHQRKHCKAHLSEIRTRISARRGGNTGESHQFRNSVCQTNGNISGHGGSTMNSNDWETRVFKWWSVLGSNQRPLRCQKSAPVEIAKLSDFPARTLGSIKSITYRIGDFVSQISLRFSWHLMSVYETDNTRGKYV